MNDGDERLRSSRPQTEQGSEYEAGIEFPRINLYFLLVFINENNVRKLSLLSLKFLWAERLPSV